MLSLSSVEGTECFVGPSEQPRQIVRVGLQRNLSRDGTVEVAGPGLRGQAVLPAGDGELVVEVPLVVDPRHQVGTAVDVVVHARAASEQEAPPARRTAVVVVAEPGWTMFLVSHFHYDPVWWNTQAAYTQVWDLQADDGLTRAVWEHNGFDLVRAHLALAASDPDYTFVLAEVDYLKPFWDTHPEARATIRELVAAGRVEIMGGTYNEPNTNLTAAETTIRNFVYGMGYQRSIIGADPQTAWQLDAFGHDPQFPGLAAEAGLTSSAWARGPHHQWGPVLSTFREVGGDVANMQFPAEFEWLSPSGKGVLTHYMPNHYSAGWWMDSSVSLEEAEDKVYELYLALKPAASTKNLLLPVGTDYTPPNKWVTAIHRDWAGRYLWPRFVCGNPREFFGAVRSELAERGVSPTPQSRDMNPVYTGKDVSFIDTKQAQRAGEVAALDAEKLATFASLLGLGGWPDRALDKVWRQLAYGAHHDAITGSESDQVYVDLLSGWREAHDIAADVRDRSLVALLGAIDTRGAGQPVVVVNTLGFSRTDIVRLRLPAGAGWRLLDDQGVVAPHLVEAAAGDEVLVAFLARDVPSIGWRTYRLVPESTAGTGSAADAGWQVEESVPGAATIANEHYRVTASPQHGGGLSSIVELGSGRELVRAGEVANELRVYDEYPSHPEFGEGPWHLLPTGAVTTSAQRAATSVRVETSALGRRLVVSGELPDGRYEQRVTVWDGVDRVDFRTRIDHTGADRLIRVKFPCPVPGARPVSEVASAVIARGFAFPDTDSAVTPWTLDNPANNFAALSSTARLRLTGPAGAAVGDYAIAVAEIVVPDLASAAPLARELVRALARVGVTATTSSAAGARHGSLVVDSNLPDIRIVLGGPDVNAFAETLLTTVEPAHAGHLIRTLTDAGAVRLFVPGETPIEAAWVPQADLRGPRAIPAVLVVATDAARLEAEVDAMAAEIRTSVLGVSCVDAEPGTLLEDYTVGLLTYGIPGFAIDTSGGLHLSLLRSCTGWPSGVWMDPPVRRAPDGSAFQLQHWTHDFDYALVAGAGDWRAQDLVSRGLEHSTQLHARATETHAGDLAPTQAMLTVSPERQVQIQAVKMTGNPCATGESVRPPERRGVTVRLSESSGLGATARLGSMIELTAAHRSDLLEERLREPAYLDGAVATALEGAEIATLLVNAAPRQHLAGSDQPLGPDREVAQPIYSRYWLHNRGPAPMGFLPISVSATPTAGRLEDGEVTVSVAVASQLGDADVVSVLDVVAPQGWITEPVQRPLRLPAAGHTTFPLRVTAPVGVEPGLYFVRIQLPIGHDEVVEEVVSVVVPHGPLDDVLPTRISREVAPEVAHETQMLGTTATTARPTGLDIETLTDAVTTVAGADAYVDFRLTNQARGDIDGELMAVSPWGSWGLVADPVQGFSVQAGASSDLRLALHVPAGVEPGSWWLLVKFMWFGRVHYSPAIPVVVRAP